MQISSTKSSSIQMPRYVRAKLRIPADVKEWLAGKDADVFGIFDNLGKSDYWLPQQGQNTASHEILFAENERGFTTLDNPFSWDKFSTMMGQLLERGEGLTKQDLMQTNSEGRTWLEQAARSGHFNAVVDYLGARGEQLGAAELLAENGQPNAAYTAAIAWGQHASVFTYENLKSTSSQEVESLLHPLPKGAQEQIPNRFALHQRLQRDENNLSTGRGR